MHKGQVPPILDHADGDRLNNRIDNLRRATSSANLANSKRPTTNRTGIKGVSADGVRFRASITSDGKWHHLGNFATLEEAAAARRKAAERLHGEFARHE